MFGIFSDNSQNSLDNPSVYRGQRTYHNIRSMTPVWLCDIWKTLTTRILGSLIDQPILLACVQASIFEFELFPSMVDFDGRTNPPMKEWHLNRMWTLAPGFDLMDSLPTVHRCSSQDPSCPRWWEDIPQDTSHPNGDQSLTVEKHAISNRRNGNFATNGAEGSYGSWARSPMAMRRVDGREDNDDWPVADSPEEEWPV